MKMRTSIFVFLAMFLSIFLGHLITRTIFDKFGICKDKEVIASSPENSFSYSKIYTKKVLAGSRIPVAVTCTDLDDNGKKEIIIVNSYGITIYRDVTFEE